MQYYFRPHRRPRAPAAHGILRQAANAAYLFLYGCLLAFAYAFGFAPARGAGIQGTTNDFRHVDYDTGMWSFADPFAFSVLSNLTPRVTATEAATLALDSETNRLGGQIRANAQAASAAQARADAAAAAAAFAYSPTNPQPSVASAVSVTGAQSNALAGATATLAARSNAWDQASALAATAVQSENDPVALAALAAFAASNRIERVYEPGSSTSWWTFTDGNATRWFVEDVGSKWHLELREDAYAYESLILAATNIVLDMPYPIPYDSTSYGPLRVETGENYISAFYIDPYWMANSPSPTDTDQIINAMSGASQDFHLVYKPTIVTNSTVYVLQTKTQIDAQALAISNAQTTATSASVLASNGVTRTIYTPIVASPTTVAIQPTQSIYKVLVSGPNTISNDLSLLAFNCEQAANWELWVDYQTTNALSTLWDARMDWGGFTPDLTVTGMYRFACSSACGTRIITKQIYPSNQPWYAFNNNTDLILFSAGSGTLAAYEQVLAGDATIPRYCVLGLRSNTTATNIFCLTGYRVNSVGTYSNNAETNYSKVSVATGVKFVCVVPSLARINAGAAAYADNALYPTTLRFELRRSNTSAAVYWNVFKYRNLNELEINAYNAGWRP